MSSVLKYITMPAMTGTMTEGKVVRWLKKPGDPVKKGEVIAEIESDKAIAELEAEHDGTIAAILLDETCGAAAIHEPLATIAVAERS